MTQAIQHNIQGHIGVCSWSLQPRNLDHLIKLVQQCGLTKLQLALDPIRTDSSSWADAGARLADAGIEIVSGMFGTIGEDYTTPQTIRETGGIVPDRHWPDNWRNIRRHAELARELELKTVSFHTGFISEHDEPAEENLVNRLRMIADLFNNATPASVLLETGQESAATLRAFLRRVDRDNVGTNFDPANMLLYDMDDPISAVRLLIPDIRQVHIKDALRPTEPGTWGVEVPVGEGQVDWSAFISALSTGGYQGHLVIERESGDDRIGDICKAVKRLTSTGVKSWSA